MAEWRQEGDGTQIRGSISGSVVVISNYVSSSSGKDGCDSRRLRRQSQSTCGASSSSPRRANGFQRSVSLLSKDASDELPKSRRELHRRPKAVTCKQISRKVVENKYVIGFTTILTVYALIGDDIRLMTTNRPADFYFNFITLTCLLCFTAEITLSCLGKDDYVFGFFFWLDIISTATLVLDLTWITAVMAAMVPSGGQSDQLRSGRTARVGARAGRVVRVIRLVRILKLYKAVYQAKNAENLRKAQAGAQANSDDWDDDDDEPLETEVKMENVQESRVGKKLSELTTRRVIILVLTMLLALPQLSADPHDQTAAAPYYAADDVWESYREMQDPPALDERDRYQHALLKIIFYNNWFTGQSAKCPGSATALCPRGYYYHLFWVGVQGSSEEALRMPAARAKLELSQVLKFQEWARLQDDAFNFGTIPVQAEAWISSSWSDTCTVKDKGMFLRGISLLAEKIDDVIDYVALCPDDLRATEIEAYSPRLVTQAEQAEWRFVFVFDIRVFTRQEAMYSIVTTCFICVVLTIASLYFSNDANRLVLGPVEKMIDRLETIRNNPLVAMKMADDEFREEEKLRAKMIMDANKSFQKRACGKLKTLVWSSTQDKQEPMETVVLEKTIIKLGSLLALGFGEAGANIIGHNMRSGDSASVNVMVAGTLVDCIIGNARIRDFSIATEVLQGKVLTFVNQIAEIVHGLIEEFHGAPNRNNGDMFLLIWQTSNLEEREVRKMADMSLVAFAKVLGGIHRSSVLANYRGHPGLQQRLGSDYRVHMSFGLHAGWAIEGAVGSEYKIDASYLSPNINVAMSVERATSVYNVPIIVSESVRTLSNVPMAKKCRLIDRVILKGAAKPLKLFSLDLDYTCLEVDAPRDPLMVWNTRQRFKARQFLETEKKNKLNVDVTTESIFNKSVDISVMRRSYGKSFIQLFNMGYQNYSQGEWEVAKRLLSAARTKTPRDDGPSAALISYMGTPYQFKAPEGWTGVRNLQDLSQHAS